MNMKNIQIISLLFFFLPYHISAQSKLISIQINDCKSKMPLPYEEIKINGQYILTDEKGKVSFTQENEQIRIGYDRIGHSFDTIFLVKNDLTSFCINKSYSLDTVEIKDYRSPIVREQNAIVFGQELIRKSTYLLGERDIVKTIQFLPGVVQGQEGSTQYYVRGGAGGENLILIDDVPIAQTSHALGFISNIDPSIVQKAKFYKGGFPAEYGNRLSSFLDIRTIDPSTLEKRKIEYNIGTLTSSIVWMQPLGKIFSFISSARSSPLSLIFEGANAVNNATNPGPNMRLNYYFYDTYQKLSFTPSNKLQISLSHFLAQDLILNSEKSKKSDEFETGRAFLSTSNNTWRNQFFALNASYSPTLKTNIRFYANNNNQDFGYSDLLLRGEFASKIQEDYDNKINTYRAGMKINYFVNNNLSIYSGVEFENHDYNNLFTKTTPVINRKERFNALNSFTSAYGMIKGKILHDKVNVNMGFRAVFDQFTNIEPRLNLDYQLKKDLKLNFAATRTSQRNHLITRETVGIPYMIWLPANGTNTPSISDQMSIGSIYEKSNFNFSLDFFVKKSKNLVLPALGQDIFVIDPNKGLINGGENVARGIEIQGFYKNDDFGSFTLNYTFSRSMIRFPSLINNTYFPSFADRPHSININYNYQMSKNWSFGATWTYFSGNVMTIPDVVYPSLGTSNTNFTNFVFRSVLRGESALIDLYTPEIWKQLQYDAASVNNHRVRSHHRLDLTATKNIIKNGKESRLSFGVYNAYFRRNPFISFLVTSPNDLRPAPNLGVRSLSLYNFIPFISYNKSI